MSQAVFGLVGVLVGGLLTALTTIWVDAWRRRAEAIVLARSLRAEILALIQAVRVQRFEEQLADLRTRSTVGDAWWFFDITADEDYFAVYSASVGRLGLLTASQAEKVVEFYTLAKAWLEDMRAGKEPADRDRAIRRLEENLALLQRVRQVGEKAASLLGGEAG